MQPDAAAFFVRSQAFEVIPPAGEGDQRAPREVDVFARYAEDGILVSGWDMGAQRHIAGRAAALRVPLGEGYAVLIGFRSQFRGQPRGTFKLLFDAILNSATEPAPPTSEEDSEK